MTLTGTTAALRGRLHHLVLASPEPERLARFYGEALDMTVIAEGAGWTCRGWDRVLRIVEGEAKSLVAAGYQVEDAAALAPLAGRLRAAGTACEIGGTTLFGDAVSFRDPDGNLLAFGRPRPAPGPVPQAMRARLQHVVVASRNAGAMVEFYTRVVGLRESDRVLDDQGGLRTCFLRTDDEHHSLAVFHAERSRLDHHCYEAGEWNLIRDWGDRFAARRIPIQWGPGRHGPGNNLFLFVHDPDGNWVEISAELELCAADRPVGVWPHEERTLNSWGPAFLRS